MDNSANMMQLCRLCLVKDEVNIPIFEEQGDIRQIFLKISSCLPVKVSREDKLPKKICDGCSYKLDMLYEFWNTSANAEKQLLSWLGEAGMSAKMNDGHMSAVAQQIKPNEMLVKEEELDPSDLHKEEDDEDEEEEKSYLFQQKLEENNAGPSATATSNEEEEPEQPPPKRARRTAAVKAAIAMDHDSDDDDDSGEPLTKMEDESEDSDCEDAEPAFVDAPSTSADDQAGPSGVGKDGADAPYALSNKSEDGLMCYACLVEYPSMEVLKNHDHVLPDIVFCTSCASYYNIKHSCSNSKLLCVFCKQYLKDVSRHKCFRTFSKADLDKIMSKQYICEMCDKEISQFDIVDHISTCEKGVCPLKNRTCRTCNVIFESLDSYRKHYYSEHLRLFSCKQCEKTFDTRGKYRKHRYQEHLEKYQVCPECGKTVVNFAQHTKAVHGNPNNVKCPLCEKTFSCNKHLYRHKLVHSDEYKHKCETCGKCFKIAFSLRVHMRTHDDVKPFQCPVCLKTFTTKQWRDNHQRTHR